MHGPTNIKTVSLKFMGQKGSLEIIEFCETLISPRTLNANS